MFFDVKDRIAPGAVLECYLTSNDEIAPVHQWNSYQRIKIPPNNNQNSSQHIKRMKHLPAAHNTFHHHSSSRYSIKKTA
jgi:hypothetical protein